MDNPGSGFLELMLVWAGLLAGLVVLVIGIGELRRRAPWRIYVARDQFLRGVTFFGVIVGAVLVALVPIAAVLAWLVIAGRDTLAQPVTLWVMVIAYAILVFTLMACGARWRKAWLWDHFGINAG